MIMGNRQGKRFLRRVKLSQRMMPSFKCGFCKRLAVPLLFLMLPFAAVAQTVPVSLVVATGADSVTCEQGRQMFRDVQAIYAPLGINLRLRWFRCLPNPRRRRTRLTGYGVDNAHWWWDEDYFIGRRKKGRRVVHYALIPPVKYKDGWYIVGQAYKASCYWTPDKRVGMSSAMMFNAAGAPRYQHSVVAMAHEIGHTLGFPHDESKSVSIMHPAPLSAVNSSSSWLPWPQSAVDVLNSCRQREK